MANTYKLKVDIKLKKTGTVPLFVQYDAARLEFKLYDGGKPFDLTGYGSVEFTHKKPSGKVVVSDGAIEVDEKGDKIIAYDYYGSEMGELGFTLVSFSLFDEDNNKISMQPFKIEVVTDLRDSLVDRANPEVGKLQEFQADLQIVKDDMIAKTEDTLLATEEALTAAANAQANAEQWKYESAYNVATQYRKNNTITFNGEGYIAKKDVKGVSPTGLLDDPNWALIAKKGADGTGTVVRHRDVFTSTANQTVFTLSKTYDQFQNRIDVTVGNVPQSSPANFIEASANTIQFTEPLPAGIQVIASYFSTAQPLKTDLETVVNSHTTTLNTTNNLITQQTTKLNEVTATLAETGTDVTKLNKRTSRVSVMEYGALGDNTTDDRQKIIDAINAVVSLKGSSSKIPELYFPYCDGYAVSGTITIPSGISVIMDAPIRYIGSLFEPCLVIGETTKTNSNVRLVLQSVRSTLSDWTNESSIGIRLINSYESDITILKAQNYTIGVQFQGDTKGFVYNEIKLFSLSGNKVNVDITSKSGGWTNENNFYGGRFSSFTDQNIGKSRYGVRITSEDAYIQNNNVFYKPSFELNVTQASPGEALPFLIERGSQNTVIGCRSEGNNATLVRILNDSTENKFHVGFGSQLTKIDDQSNYPASSLEINRRVTTDRDGKALFSIHNIHKKACYYDGVSSINIPGLFLGGSGNANIGKSLSSYTINTDYLELGVGRCIGVFIDTRNAKRFLIRRDVLVGNEGRVAIRCYDASGAVLTNVGLGHPYVKSMVYSVFNYNTGYGGMYQTGSDTNQDFYINLHADVAKIAILLINGTNVCRVRGFSIYGLDSGHASVYSGYEEVIPNVNLGTALPTVGTWEKGRIILNDNKSELGTAGSKYVIEGWECLTAGTPGTWIQKRSLTGN